MRTYRLYITTGTLSRQGHWNEIAWARNVRATSRIGALNKCLPEIRKQVLPFINDDTIKVVSVHCGIKNDVSGSASRLAPLRLTRDGKLKAV